MILQYLCTALEQRLGCDEFGGTHVLEQGRKFSKIVGIDQIVDRVIQLLDHFSFGVGNLPSCEFQTKPGLSSCAQVEDGDRHSAVKFCHSYLDAKEHGPYSGREDDQEHACHTGCEPEGCDCCDLAEEGCRVNCCVEQDGEGHWIAHRFEGLDTAGIRNKGLTREMDIVFAIELQNFPD
jgi:hypothetical protein